MSRTYREFGDLLSAYNEADEKWTPIQKAHEFLDSVNEDEIWEQRHAAADALFTYIAELEAENTALKQHPQPIEFWSDEKKELYRRNESRTIKSGREEECGRRAKKAIGEEEMSEKLIPCPICGSENTVRLPYNDRADIERCKNCNLTIIVPFGYTMWNTRPIEDALQAENERLKEDLQHEKTRSQLNLEAEKRRMLNITYYCAEIDRLTARIAELKELLDTESQLSNQFYLLLVDNPKSKKLADDLIEALRINGKEVQE